MNKWDLERAEMAEKRREMEAKSNKILAIFFGCEVCLVTLFLLWVIH